MGTSQGQSVGYRHELGQISNVSDLADRILESFTVFIRDNCMNHVHRAVYNPFTPGNTNYFSFRLVLA